MAIAALVVVLVLCLAGLAAVSMQARGDDRSAVEAARRIAPPAARIQVRRDGDFLVATVVAHSKLLPTLDIAAKAVAAAEPSPASGRYPQR